MVDEVNQDLSIFGLELLPQLGILVGRADLRVAHLLQERLGRFYWGRLVGTLPHGTLLRAPIRLALPLVLPSLILVHLGICLYILGTLRHLTLI